MTWWILRWGLVTRKMKPCLNLETFSPNSHPHGRGEGLGAAKLLQSCPTLRDPIDSSPPGSPVPGILQAKILEWVAISSSNARKWKVKVKLLNCVWLLVTPWTVASQAPPSMRFSRQEYWSGVPLPSPRGAGDSVNYWSYLCNETSIKIPKV